MGRSRKTPPIPLSLPDDDPHFAEVVSWAEGEGFAIRRPSPSALKIGPFNYWPTKRKFNSDHAPHLIRWGYEEFKAAVKILVLDLADNRTL